MEDSDNTLKELIDGNFSQLENLIYAANSGDFIEGRDNVGIYALPDSHRVDLFEMWKSEGRVTPSLAKEAEEEDIIAQDLDESILIRGPLNPDVVFGAWSIAKYMLDNATDFRVDKGMVIKSLGGGFTTWDYSIKAKVPGSPTEEQTVLLVRDNQYCAKFSTPLSGNKYGEVDVMFSDGLILDGIFANSNSFGFETYEHDGDKYDFDRSKNYDVYLNGPSEDPVIADVLMLGKAMKDYILSKVEVTEEFVAECKMENAKQRESMQKSAGESTWYY